MLAKKSLLIGLTSDQMIGKKSSPEYIQPFSLRKKKILDFVQNMNYKKIEINVKSLSDQVGGADLIDYLDSLVLTEETIKGGLLVNEVYLIN